jgi:hypothetical protein
MGPKKRKKRKYKSPLSDLGAFRYFVITKGKIPRGWKRQTTNPLGPTLVRDE